ncbi:MAG: DUF721 domain-containing protein [Nitrospirae bacterium]|nr:DUF721 domain-containing protein [Nitrospirota bacterium]
MSRLQRASVVIESLAGHLGMEDGMMLERIKNRWHELIGTPTSLNCQPAFFKSARLTINVSSNVWMTQLNFLEGEIVSMLSEFGVVSIKLRPGPVGWPPQTAAAALPDAQLSAGEVAYVESLSAGIKDDELRELLRRAALKSFARIKAVDER